MNRVWMRKFDSFLLSLLCIIGNGLFIAGIASPVLQVIVYVCGEKKSIKSFRSRRIRQIEKGKRRTNFMLNFESNFNHTNEHQNNP